ncbi:alpha/beta fold hydrolase [Chitinophaga sp. 212800010-3]|uniref:alpha/beta hydrolase n=1 Tax=unclassified Chitinophaga TaxID=2619133 RepID=UPI002DE6B2A7|nr:Hydrolase-4 domain-containing protein [Chitinophaga sp. 212800010-3]
MNHKLLKSILLMIYCLLPLNMLAQEKDRVVSNFFEQMGKGNWNEATRDMDGNMKRQVTPDILQQLWAQMERTYGTWETFASQRIVMQRGYRLVFAENHFKQAVITFRVALDSLHHIAGFSIADTKGRAPALSRMESSDSVGTADGGTLYGTLLIPDNVKTCPVALIIAGSGPTDRNGNSILVGKADADGYRLLANALAAAGIASLRYDKRWVGQSSSGFKKEPGKVTIEDYMTDAVTWLEHLQHDQRFSGVVVIGHSEGALIGSMMAQQHTFKSLVSLAGPADPMDQILLAQLKPRLPDSLYRNAVSIFHTLRDQQDPVAVPEALHIFFNPGIYEYWKSAVRLLPCSLISQVKIPVLILNGTADVQIPPAQARQLKQCLPAARLELIGGMPHLLKDTQSSSNSASPLPLCPSLLTPLVNFIRE